MAQFIIGVVVLGLLYLGAQFFMRANPKSLAKTLRQLVGVLLLGVGTVLVLSVRLAPLALPVFLAAAAIMFGDRVPLFRRRGRGDIGSARGKTSKVKTAFFQMELDHKAGEMDGVVCAGQFEGERLSKLGPSELKLLYEEITSHSDVDTDSLSLLETYLDSVISSWREDFHVDNTTGHGGAARAGPISEEEAYEILGLGRDAGVDEIRAAHRSLMLKFHPDRGGATVLAAKINEAKDVLLRNHSSKS